MAVIEQIVEATRNPRWLLVSYWLHGKPHFWGALYSFTYHSAFKKNDFIPRDLIPPSFVPFKHLQLDFIQLTLSMVINMFLLLYICFLDGMKPSPAEKADTLTVAKKLLENVFSLYIPMFIGT